MAEKKNSPITTLLGDAAAGKRAAHDRLWELLYDELRKSASFLSSQRGGAALQTTEIVNEAYAQFAARERPDLTTEIEFKRYATKVMKHVVYQAARKRRALKGSGQWQREPLTGQLLEQRSPEKELQVQRALTKLWKSNAEAAEAIELQQYGGYKIPEIATLLGVGLTKAKRLLDYAERDIKLTLGGTGL